MLDKILEKIFGPIQDTHHVRCGCGNIVLTKKLHDFSVLPCEECRRRYNEKEDR